MIDSFNDCRRAVELQAAYAAAKSRLDPEECKAEAYYLFCLAVLDHDESKLPLLDFVRLKVFNGLQDYAKTERRREAKQEVLDDVYGREWSDKLLDLTGKVKWAAEAALWEGGLMPARKVLRAAGWSRREVRRSLAEARLALA